MPKFEIKKGHDHQYRFHLKAGNGEIILVSEGYTTKANCEHGITSVKSNAPHDERYEHLVAKNGKPYFNLKAINGQVIGTSQMYASAAARDHGILSVKENAPKAVVVEI